MLRTGLLVGFLLTGAVVLAIVSAVQFRNLNNSVTASCFITSIQFGSSFGSESIIRNRVVYNIIVYESDGSNTTTTAWSPITGSTALLALSGAQFYRLNRTYPCYHDRSPSQPVQVRFDRPSKTKAVGFLCGCIVLFLLAAGVGCLKCCMWLARKEKVAPANHPHAPMYATEMVTMPTTASASEVEQQHTVEPPPPSYEEAVEQTGFERLRRSAGNAFNGLSFSRQTSNTNRV